MRPSGRSSRARPAKSSSRSPDDAASEYEDEARTPAPSRRTASALVALLAIVASIRGLLNDFVYDDVPIIQNNLRVHELSLARVRDIFAHAYWPPPFVEQLYRPLTLLALGVEFAAGAGSPIVFRLVSYALYAATSVLVYRLATRLLDPWPSLAVAALFAVHPVHVEAVALGVNQAELIVGLIALVMTTLYIDRRRAGFVRSRDWVLLTALFGVATLVKESAFVLPFFLIAADVTVLRRRGERFPVRSDLLGYALLALVGVASLVLRFAVAGSPAFAVVPAADLRGLDLVGRLGVMLHVVPMWLRLLVWPRHLQVDFAPGEIESGGVMEAAFGFAIVCGLVVAIVYALRRAPVVAFGLLWTTLALLPVSNILPTGVLLAERTLFLPSVGFMIVVGAIGQNALGAALTTRPRRIAIGVACSLLVMLGLLRSIGREAVWNTAHLKLIPSSSTGAIR